MRRQPASALVTGAAAVVLVVWSGSMALGQQAAGTLIRNGTFDTDIAGWSAWFAPGQAEGRAEWVQRDDGGCMAVTVRGRDTSSAVQIFQGAFTVHQGAWCSVSFEARAEAPMSMRVAVMRHNPPYGPLGLSADVMLGTEWETLSLLAQATDDSDDTRIDFFPEASFQLDNVVVRELGERPQRWPIGDVRPGPGWQADAVALIDGDPQSRVTSRYYPVLPLFMVLDLGEVRPVGAVIVHGVESGRHSSVDALEVEVAAEDQQWLRWARAAKSAEGNVAAARQTLFVATNVAVPVRWLRLRIPRLRGNACLTEVEVVAAPAASAGALTRLPPVRPEKDLAFMGWDYDRLGYDASPGEQVGLRFTNQGDRPVRAPAAWRLESYLGDEITQGQAALNAGPRATAEAPFSLPASLRDGPYRVRFRVGEAEHEDALYFDYRVAEAHDVLGLRLVALLDNVEPEGWVRLMCGPVARFVDVRRSLPDDTSAVDAALVMAESWPADSPAVNALREHLRSGGRAVFYGKVAPALADLLPVEIDYDDPWLDTPQRLQPPTFWPDFDPGNGPRHYGVRATAKPDTTVLGQWADGMPAVVEGRYGEGHVLYVGAGPGRSWQWRPGLEGADELSLRAVYYLLGRDEASTALARLADATARTRGPAEGVSAGNMGRFGWLVEEGGLVENLGGDAEIHSPATRVPWRVSVPGRGPLTGCPVELNWIAKTTEWRDEQGLALESTMSIAAPCILWEGDARQLRITGEALHAAYETADGPRVLSAGDTAFGADMATGWIVLFGGGDDGRDSPRIVVLSRRPAQVRLGDGLELTWDGGFGALWTGSLFGVRRFALSATDEWADTFPDEAASQALDLARQCQAFPVGAREEYRAEADSVAITDRFVFREFADDWGTSPDKLAPLPPILSLVRAHGYPVEVEGEVRATGIATKYGPLEGVSGDTVRYHLPLPPRDHFGVIPVEGKMDLAEAINHHGVEGTSTVQRSSGGLTTSDPFLADLRAYMGVGSVSPFEAVHLDLYKWWYCFPTVLGRPAYGSEARTAIDAHHREHYWRTLNFYPHKSIIRYRREPWTGLDYTVTFIWPVTFRDGVRYFVDQNESAAVILYCMEGYARYYGDWTTVGSNWNLVNYLHLYLRRVHDWALMASSNQEFYSTVGIDMLNSEYPGNLAFARMARQVGDEGAEALGLYLAAKAVVPAVARLYLPDYVESITAPGDPWREARYYWSLSETGLAGQESMVQRGDTEFIVALAAGMLDTSKGTSPEIALAYKHFARDRMDAYEREVLASEGEHNVSAGWAHLMQRAFVGWPRDELIATAKRFSETHWNWGWQSTKGPHNLAVVCVADTPLFLADWAPSEYVAGRFTPDDRTARLTLNNHEDEPCTVRLYSQWLVQGVQLNGALSTGWTYDDGTGWLTLNLEQLGEARLEIALGQERVAPPHPYFR